MSFRFPIERGQVVDWDDFEMMLFEALGKELHVENLETVNYVILENVTIESMMKERLIEIMFDKFNAKSVTFLPQSYLTMLHYGKTTALVVDMGKQMASVTPYYENVMLEGQIKRMAVGGESVTRCLAEMMRR